MVSPNGLIETRVVFEWSLESFQNLMRNWLIETRVVFEFKLTTPYKELGGWLIETRVVFELRGSISAFAIVMID